MHHSYFLGKFSLGLIKKIFILLKKKYDFREDSSKSHLFFQHIHEDKTENSLSYVEFIRYLNDQVSKG